MAATGGSRPGVDRLVAGLAQLCLFVGAGGVATLTHYLLLAALVESGLLPPTPATCVGYAIASALNYWMRRRFVFRSGVSHRRTLPRYAAVAAGGFALNGGVMALGTGALGLPYAAVQVGATGLVLLWNFVGHRLWTFREAPDDPAAATVPAGPLPASFPPRPGTDAALGHGPQRPASSGGAATGGADRCVGAGGGPASPPPPVPEAAAAVESSSYRHGQQPQRAAAGPPNGGLWRTAEGRGGL